MISHAIFNFSVNNKDRSEGRDAQPSIPESLYCKGSSSQITYLKHNISVFGSPKSEWAHFAPLNSEVEQVGVSDGKSDQRKDVALFVSELMHFLDSDDFEAGVKSGAEKYIESKLAENAIVAQLGVGTVFLSCTDKPRRLVGILAAVSHLDQKAFSPMNELVALSALSHSSIEVKESAVRAYEYWEDPVLVGRLKDFQLTPNWLDEYRQEVISDICGDS